MPTPTYTPLYSATLSATATSVVIPDIAQTFRDLVLVCTFIGSGTANDSNFVKFNTSTANFTTIQMYGDSGTPSSNTGSTGRISNYENSTGRPYPTIVQIMDYSATDKHKTYLSRYNADNVGVGGFVGRWAQTTAISSIEVYPISGSYASGTTVALYGIASA